MVQVEKETLVNSDVLLQEYESAYNKATQDMEYCDSKIQEQNVLKGQAAICAGEALYNIRQHLTDEEWKDWYEEHEPDKSKRSRLLNIYENFGCRAATMNLEYTAMRELITLGENLEDFMSQHDVESISSRELRKAIKIYKGEVSPEENSGKGATPMEDNQPDTETVDVTALENKVSALRMKNSIQKKKIKQLQTENQRLRDENRILNERGGPLTNALCIDGTHIGNIVNYHTGEITRENFNAVDNLAEQKKQEELDALCVTG